MSPILDLQRRLREVGRIRIGDTVAATSKSGKDIRRPRKLTTFKFTSRDPQVIASAAELFGGEPGPWDEQAGQHQVVTDVDVISVIVPPSEMSFSQFYELWSGGGCQRRCDGHYDVINEKDCVCDPERRECSIHTRLSVIIPDLPGLGVWRIDTQGYYAAVEIGGAVEVCQAVAARGQHLPARLRLEQREVKRIGRDNRPETRKFAVPVLDVDVLPSALLGAGSGTPVAITAPAAGELPAAAAPVFQPAPAAQLGPAPSIADQVADSANRPQPKPRKNAATPIPATNTAPSTAAESNNLTCSRCGRPYTEASVVKGNAGESKYVHGTCPDGGGDGDGAPTSGPDGPGSASDGAHPTATSDDQVGQPEGLRLDGQAEEEPAPAATSSARSTRAEQEGLTARDIGQEATKVWPTDTLPKGKATKERDRRKYTVAHALTNGPVHYDDLDRSQRYQLWRTLNDIAEGRIELAEDDTGLLLTKGGQTHHADWWIEPVEAERGAA